MNQLTPAQQKVIETWTEKRDGLLREIGVYETRLNDLKGLSTDAGLALADLHKQIEFAKGRLTELNALEERHKTSLNIEVVDLEVRKTKLQSECTALEAELLKERDTMIVYISALDVLVSASDTLSAQSKLIDEVVGKAIATSESHLFEIKNMVESVKTISDEVIGKGNENVTQTNIILDKLPRYIFELQKPIPIRRAYAVPRGKVVESENKKD